MKEFSLGTRIHKFVFFEMATVGVAHSLKVRLTNDVWVAVTQRVHVDDFPLLSHKTLTLT